MSVSDITQAIAAILLAISLLYAAYQASIAAQQARLLRTQIKDEFEWRRREKAVSFSQIYIDPMREAKNRIVEAFEEYIQVRKDPISNKELEQAIKPKKITQNEIDYFLSYLETIGIAVRFDVASFDVVYELIAHTYVQYYFVFIPYINEQRDHNPKLWVNVERLSDQLIEEMKKRGEMPIHYETRQQYYEAAPYKFGDV